MKVMFINICLFFLLTASIISCQNQGGSDVTKVIKTDEKIITSAHLPIPCKNISSPLIKDKTKLKDMLFKEGKLNIDMTKEEINSYINAYIKNKSSMSCKPRLKKTTSIEITPHA